MALLPVEQALVRILAGAKPLTSETVELLFSHGRVLANPVRASRDQPPFRASAMDGYAVRQSDLAAIPAIFRVAGAAAAGHAFRGRSRPGDAIRISTGAPVPHGFDTVVIQENASRDGDTVIVRNPTAPGRNIRDRGLDFKRGEVLLAKGTLINARDIGLAAAGNAAYVRAYRRPHVMLFTTGDELVLPGQKPRSDQIVTSNSLALQAMLTNWGAKVTNLGIVKDKLAATKRAIRRGLQADLLVTTGGASVGDHDFVQEALKSCGVDVNFWKIALRPGKPLMYGRKRSTRVIGLPGNPVSALVCARLFIRPLLFVLSGLSTSNDRLLARLTVNMPMNDNRTDYVRATLSVMPDGTRTVTPFPLQDSSMQRTLRNAHCLIVREAEALAAKSGDSVEILILDF